MELLQLKYLCTAARLENFSRAARHHNIPQSAISKTVLQLERELGVQLFIRTGNRVALSEAGRVFCREVQRSLDILNEAVDHAKAGRTTCRGEVRLLLGAHRDEVLRLVAAFCRENADVTFHIDSAPVSDAAYDLCITPRHAAMGTGGSLHVLRGEEIHLLVPATHRLAEAEQVSLSDLQGERLVALSEQAPYALPVQERLAAAGLSLPIVITCDDLHSLCAYVAAGSGIAFVAGVSEPGAREMGISRLRLTDSSWRYPTCVSCPRGLSPAARAFLAALVARLG